MQIVFNFYLKFVSAMREYKQILRPVHSVKKYIMVGNLCDSLKPTIGKKTIGTKNAS